MIELILSLIVNTTVPNPNCDPELGCIIIEEPKCTKESPCPIIDPDNE